MSSDLWHYPRTTLATQILDLFESGLSSALVFFAPRRMGKTEFLRKDISPAAKSRHWKVFYFSFLDISTTATREFTKALMLFAEESGATRNKTHRILKNVGKISGEAIGIKAEIEFNKDNINESMKEVFSALSKKGKILLLMDEVQALAQNAKNNTFVAALRTALDIHKDEIKVIFTGSSQNELRRMFSMAKAPFFHFGQNLPFPALDKGFIDHLARAFKIATKRTVDKETLWSIFQETHYTPQLMRSLVERLALQPGLELITAKQELLSEIYNDRSFVEIWEKCSALEKLLLHSITENGVTLFSKQTREAFAKILGIEKLSTTSQQSALRVLLRKKLIGQYPDRGGYFIEDPSFKSWLLEKDKS